MKRLTFWKSLFLLFALIVGSGTMWGQAPDLSSLDFGTPQVSENFNGLSTYSATAKEKNSSYTANGAFNKIYNNNTYNTYAVTDNNTFSSRVLSLTSGGGSPLITSITGKTFGTKGAYKIKVLKTSKCYVGFYGADDNTEYQASNSSVYIKSENGTLNINNGSSWVSIGTYTTDIIDIVVIYNNTTTASTYGESISIGAKKAHIYVNGSCVMNGGNPKAFTIPGANLTAFRVLPIAASTNTAIVDDVEIYNALPTSASSVSTPTFLPVAGAVEKGTSVTISSTTDESTIYYTTDGTEPTTSSSHGTVGSASASVTVDAAMTIKAIAIKNEESSSIATASYTIKKVETPTISVVTGTYNNNKSVTLGCSTEGATIRYTTDETTPTSTTGNVYSEAITVSSTQTITAKAFKTGYDDSEAVSATYTMVVSNPTLSVAAGTYDAAQSVQLTCGTEDATIRYTTNGTEPTEGSSAYSNEAIPVNVSQTIRAKAFKTGYTASGETSAAYTLKCATPTITKADGDFVTTKVITMASSDGATIRYTTDGSTEPTTSVGTVYDPDNKPEISATTTFKAIAYKEGWTSSDVASETFTKETVLNGLTDLVAITEATTADYYVNLTNTQITWTNGNSVGYIEDASHGAYWSAYSNNYKPTLNNVYNNGIYKVKYQYNNQMPTIKYAIKVEGDDPAVGSAKAPTVMTAAALDEAFTANLGRQIQINNFTVTSGKNLTDNIAIVDNGDYTTVTAGHTYTLVGYPYNNNGTKQFRVVTAVEAPTFDPEEGVFYNAFDLTLTCTTAGADIYYTTDGITTPTTSSTKYTEAFEIPAATTTVKAIAVKNGVASNVAEATYTYYAVKQPIFVTASPVYYNDKAEVSCETDGSSLYYTLTTDGSEPAEPTDASKAYPDGGITIAANTVKIKVIAKKGSDYSPVASATYTLTNPVAPTADPDAGIVEPGTTVALSAGAGTSIYYNINSENDPDDNSTPYTGAITIDADKTIKAVAYDGAGNKGAVLTAAYQIFTNATFSVADMTIEVGEQKAPTVTTDSEGTVSFESGNTDIATIVDGKVNGVAKGTVTITANITASGTKRAASTTFKVTVKNPAVWESSSKGIDELTYSSLGFGTSSNITYTDFSNVSSTSDAIYAGQAAKKTNLGFIQIRTKNSNSGVVTTTSGGKARKVVVTWNSSNGSNGNTIDIYGKSSAYTGASDLFGDATAQGQKLGSIVRGTSTELKISGDYAFIGIRSNDGTCYLDNIDIYWEGDAVSLTDASDYTPVAKDYAKVTLNRKFVAGWNGIILPFDLTTDVKTALGATEVKTLDDATLYGNVVSLSFADATLPVDAGTPVLVKLAAAQESGDVVLNGVEIKTTDPTTIAKTVEDNTFTLTGTYSQANLTSSEVYLVSNKTFYHKAAGTALTAKPFRSYIVQTAAAGSRLIDVNFDLEGGTTTGIVEVSGNGTKDNNQNQYYDLQGRKVAKPNKGIYIVNGKKVVIK